MATICAQLQMVADRPLFLIVLVLDLVILFLIVLVLGL